LALFGRRPSECVERPSSRQPKTYTKADIERLDPEMVPAQVHVEVRAEPVDQNANELPIPVQTKCGWYAVLIDDVGPIRSSNAKLSALIRLFGPPTMSAFLTLSEARRA
jgi:hypothetical protein